MYVFTVMYTSIHWAQNRAIWLIISVYQRLVHFTNRGHFPSYPFLLLRPKIWYFLSPNLDTYIEFCAGGTGVAVFIWQNSSIGSNLDSTSAEDKYSWVHDYSCTWEFRIQDKTSVWRIYDRTTESVHNQSSDRGRSKFPIGLQDYSPLWEVHTHINAKNSWVSNKIFVTHPPHPT